MKKNFLSLICVALLSLFGVSTANSMEVYTEPFTIGPGQVVTVKFYVKNATEGIQGLDVNFNLPKSVTLVGVTEGTAKDVKDNITINPKAAFFKNYECGYEPTRPDEDGGQYMLMADGAQIFLGKTLTDEGDWFFSVDVQCTGEEEVNGKIDILDLSDFLDEGGKPLFDMSGEYGELTLTDAEVTVKKNFTATMAASGYTSICSTTDLDFSDVEGLTAYVVSKAEGGKATLTEVENAPANTGVILKGDAGTTYEIPTGSATAPDANLLKGVTAATKIAGDGSQFFLVGGKFVKAAESATLPAGKAYLTASASAKAFDVLEFDFDGDATAIQNVEKEQFDGAIYNLNGVRVDNPTKGVYVKDGKKFVVK